MRPMKLTRTTRWVIAGAALGLSVATFSGVAFAATPGSTGGAGGTPPSGGASAPALAETAATTAPGGTAPSSTQAPTGNTTMMSEMLASLSPQARAEFQALYPQMLQLMNSSHMMSGTGSAGSMMSTGPPSSGQPSAP